MLRAEFALDNDRQCSLKVMPSDKGKALSQQKLLQTFYVTFVARLLYEAGEGQTADHILGSARILFDGLMQRASTAKESGFGDCLQEYDRLRLVDHLLSPAEQHQVVLVRRRDNSVVCTVKSYSWSRDLLMQIGPWVVVKYAGKTLGERAYKDLSDALHRMCRFYRDIPYWQKEGLLAVPSMTLGILRK